MSDGRAALGAHGILVSQENGSVAKGVTHELDQHTECVDQEEILPSNI